MRAVETDGWCGVFAVPVLSASHALSHFPPSTEILRRKGARSPHSSLPGRETEFRSPRGMPSGVQAGSQGSASGASWSASSLGSHTASCCLQEVESPGSAVSLGRDFGAENLSV